MTTPTEADDDPRLEFEEWEARLGRRLDRATSDAERLAVRDLLLDHQFATRALITRAEERLGAFDGTDHPRALAARAEELIEQIEALQESLEERVSLLLELGYRDDAPLQFLAVGRAPGASTASWTALFDHLPAELDQAVEALEYARRFLLGLLEGAGSPGRGAPPRDSTAPPGASRRRAPGAR